MKFKVMFNFLIQMYSDRTGTDKNHPGFQKTTP